MQQESLAPAAAVACLIRDYDDDESLMTMDHESLMMPPMMTIAQGQQA
jgi:hypothetical protein